MTKGLEALERFKQPYMMCDLDWNNRVEIIEKELQALDIIKEKEINIHALLLHLKRFDSPSGYNALIGAKYQITQEEYDLLKEMLL